MEGRIGPIVWSQCYDTINQSYVSKIRVGINKAYKDKCDRDNYVTVENVRNTFLGMGMNHETLLTVFVQHNEDYSKQVGKIKSEPWFERKFFGKKSEKVPPMDSNQLSLFHAEEVALVEEKEEESKQASEQIKESIPVVKKDRKVHMMIEGLRVEEIIMEIDSVDLICYKRIVQKESLVLRHQHGEVYVEKIIRPKYALKDNLRLPESREKPF